MGDLRCSGVDVMRLFLEDVPVAFYISKGDPEMLWLQVKSLLAYLKVNDIEFTMDNVEEVNMMSLKQLIRKHRSGHVLATIITDDSDIYIDEIGLNALNIGCKTRQNESLDNWVVHTLMPLLKGPSCSDSIIEQMSKRRRCNDYEALLHRSMNSQHAPLGGQKETIMSLALVVR